MIVKIGIVEKNIPQEYKNATEFITIEMLENTKKRLTPWERFLFAEAAWRSGLDQMTKIYLEYFSPECVVREINRTSECRYIVKYVDGIDSDNSRNAVTTKAVALTCPSIVDEYKDWG